MKMWLFKASEKEANNFSFIFYYIYFYKSTIQKVTLHTDGTEFYPNVAICSDKH